MNEVALRMWGCIAIRLSYIINVFFPSVPQFPFETQARRMTPSLPSPPLPPDATTAGTDDERIAVIGKI